MPAGCHDRLGWPAVYKNMSSTQTWKVRHRVVVPGRHRQSVMQLAHDNISSGHVGAELQYRGEGAPRYHGGNPGIRCLHWPWTHHHLQRPPPARLAQPSQNLQPAYSALGASPLRIRPHSQTRERSGEQTS